MAVEQIGRLKSGKTRKDYKVFWDAGTRSVFVGTFGGFLSSGGSKNVGKASSASEAMRKAEAYLYDK
jgi:hypothetical protein